MRAKEHEGFQRRVTAREADHATKRRQVEHMQMVSSIPDLTLLERTTIPGVQVGFPRRPRERNQQAVGGAAGNETARYRGLESKRGATCQRGEVSRRVTKPNSKESAEST